MTSYYINIIVLLPPRFLLRWEASRGDVLDAVGPAGHVGNYVMPRKVEGDDVVAKRQSVFGCSSSKCIAASTVAA